MLRVGARACVLTRCSRALRGAQLQQLQQHQAQDAQMVRHVARPDALLAAGCAIHPRRRRCL
jgi:hypothetical protein